MEDMTPDSGQVLFLGRGGAAIEPAIRILDSNGLHIRHATDAATAVHLVWSIPFDLLVVDHPLTDVTLETLIITLRDRASPCRCSGLVLLAEPTAIDEARTWLGRGVNRVVGRGGPKGELLVAVADLLHVSPRVEVQAMVQIEGHESYGATRALIRTRNLSLSGMLLSGGREHPVGTPLGFELHLPGENAAVLGAAHVVRHTNSSRERVEGIGVRFGALSGSGQTHLAAYIQRTAD